MDDPTEPDASSTNVLHWVAWCEYLSDDMCEEFPDIGRDDVAHDTIQGVLGWIDDLRTAQEVSRVTGVAMPPPRVMK